MKPTLNLKQGVNSEFKIRLLNLKKRSTNNNIPPKILKSSSEATANVLHKLF